MRLAPVPENQVAAGNLIEVRGLHLGHYWPKACSTQRIYRAPAPLDVFGAIAVAQDVLHVDDVTADIAYGGEPGDHGPCEEVLALIDFLGMDTVDDLRKWSDQMAVRGDAGKMAVAGALYLCADGIAARAAA